MYPDVGDNILLVHGHGQDLPLPVDTDDAVCWLMLSSDKDGISTDSVHVNAGPGLDIVQVDIAVLSDQVHHAVLP